jgi:uncharacterized membrane protein/nitrite reductase/ring-hydroxylating ferredoxin subunit
MKSRIVVMGHPLHPMLIPFPFAFLTGAAICDLVTWIWGFDSLWVAGRVLIAAGVCAGVLAAVPGAVDYLTVVPPRSSGKTRATKHMLCNSAALVSFALAWLLREDSAAAAHPAVLLLELAGAVLLGAGGWLGGTLVYRNQIAVDHRYAEAGKWAEASINRTSGQIDVTEHARDLGVNQMKLLHIGQTRVVLGRTDDGCVAFADRCTHKGGSLADGVMICGTVQCPWHGSQFDTSTGAVRSGPATREIAAYPVSDKKRGLQLDLGGLSE